MQTSDPLLIEQHIRKDFPSLELQVHGRPLVYLDNAASTFKPLPVLDAERSFYIEKYANVHRGGPPPQPGSDPLLRRGPRQGGGFFGGPRIR